MLKGKTAVVTGSTSGIGLGIARVFAQDGANVVINGFGDKAAIEKERASIEKDFGVKATYSAADMTKPAEIADMIKTAEKTFGAVDVLVNNAGIQHVDPIENFPIEKWDQIIAINLSSAFHTCRAAVPGMKARKWGRIINVLNIGAKAPAAASTPTSVSRAAGMALTKAMANEGGAHNILVNAMLVGLIVSDQWVKRHATKAPGTDFDAFTRDLAKGVPLGRMGTAEEFANMACFLASEQGSYITGTAINVDGGRSPVV